MTIPMNSFLKNTLLLDAVVSGAAAVLMAVGAGLLGPFLNLPVSLLFWAGIVLLPWVALLVVLSRRPSLSRMVLLDVVLVNVAWVVASIGILAFGFVEPNMLGVAFVVAQALAVALFAVLQYAALRQARPAMA